MLEITIHFSAVKFIPGDENKDSMTARGLDFEMILHAIGAGKVLAFESHPSRPDQKLLIVEIAGYAVAAPCERRGDAWRIITAYPSRKHHKRYLP